MPQPAWEIDQAAAYGLVFDVLEFETLVVKIERLTERRQNLASAELFNMRSGDAAARFGGEEFAAFLLDAELSQALVAAERIRSEVEKHKFTVVRRGTTNQKHRVTISIGVSSFPDDSLDPIELVEMADSALYRAKHEGRNRVCAYRDLTAEEAKRPLPARLD